MGVQGLQSMSVQHRVPYCTHSDVDLDRVCKCPRLPVPVPVSIFVLKDLCIRFHAPFALRQARGCFVVSVRRHFSIEFLTKAYFSYLDMSRASLRAGELDSKQ